MRTTFLAAATVLASLTSFLLLFAEPRHAQENSAANSQHGSAPEILFAQRISLPGVPNFAEVTPVIARGGQPSSFGFEALARRGVAMVVDLRDDGNRAVEKARVEKLGMQYVPLSWNCRHPSDELVVRFLEILRANPEKKVFVHCHYGVDRTGLMIAAYRMAEQAWTAAQARREMEAFGFDLAHQSWCRSLGSYQRSFPQRYSLDPAFQSLRPGAQASANAAPR